MGQKGFTIMELLVVIFVIGTIASLFIANYAGLRGPRNLKIAQNELVTHIRKIQSYTLSAQNTTTGVPAHFYVMKFDTSTPTSYKIQTIDNSPVPVIVDSEIITLPRGIRFRTANPFAIQQNGVGTFVNYPCVQIAYALPFGKMYADGTCAMQTQAASSAKLDIIDNAIVQVVLENTTGATTNMVEINAITGAVIAK